MEAFNSVSLFKLMDTFKTDEDCKKYLYELKFYTGFRCSKCNSTKSWKGIKPYTKVCKSCRHVESATSNTLFHKVKFGLRKAFHIIFDMTTTSAGISALQVSRKYEIKYRAAWLFMKKVRLSMESINNYPMVDTVYVDEYVIGGYEKGAVGRKTDSKKIKAIMAVEATKKGGVKRMYSMKIENYSTEEIGKIFEKHISYDADVRTDEWKGYSPLRMGYNITMDKKIKDNSPVNRMIQQQKSWLRGTYHSINSYHTETYFNEYSFRINRSQWKDSIFHKCVERMVYREKKSRLQLSEMKCWTREQFVLRVKLYRFNGGDYVIKEGKMKLYMAA